MIRNDLCAPETSKRLTSGSQDALNLRGSNGNTIWEEEERRKKTDVIRQLLHVK